MARVNRVAISILLMPVIVIGCGFTVHMLNTHRALSTFASTPLNPSFMEDVYANTGSVFAGSPYPDYLYQCGGNGDDGEWTHWSGFQAVASVYIREQYPPPRNASGRALVAFLAGIASHYMADVSWHGMGPPHGYGFIETIGAKDFGTGLDLDMRPHSFSDNGGEFAAAYENVLPWDDPTAWVIPLNDLLTIYHTSNRTDVTAAAIEECAGIFFAGAEAVAAAAALADPLLEQQSPTFAEHLTELPMGGWDDMSVMLSRIWARLATWIERMHPIPIPGHEYCNERNPCAVTPRPSLTAAHAAFRAMAPALHAAGLVNSSRLADGSLVLVRNAQSPREVLAAVASGLRALADGSPRTPSTTARLAAGWTAPASGDDDAANVAARIAAALSLPRALGAAGAHAVADALDSLGAPRAPTMGAAAPATLPAPAPVAFAAAGTVALEYAGAALAVGDFDGDGSADLVITAYGASPIGTYVDDAVGVAPSAPVANAVLPQAGGWYVRSGGAARGAALRAAPAPEVLAPATRTTGGGVYARLGQAACVLDFNLDGIDDLAVGAPTAGWAWAADPWGEAPLYYYQGRVDIFLGARGAGLPPAATPSVTIVAAANLSMFGAVLACDADLSGDGHADLAVGSPMWGPGGDRSPPAEFAVQRGRADVFFAGAGWPARASVTDANFSTLGAMTYAWSGASLAGAPDAGALGVTPREAARVALGAVAGDSDEAAAARAPPACVAAAAAALAVPADAAVGALLLVGSPGFSPSAAAAPGSLPPYALVTGRVEAYVLPAPGSAAAALAACTRAAPVPLFTVTADAGYGVTGNATPKLGAAVALGRPLGPAGGLFAALGMPDTDQCNSSALSPGGAGLFLTAAGAVAVVELTPALRGDVTWTSMPSRARLYSSLPDARFGLRVSFRAGANASSPDDLVVGAPHYSRLFIGGVSGSSGDGPAPTPAGDSGREAGALFLLRGGAAFPAGDVCAAEARATWWAEGAAEHGRLGSAWIDFDWNSDGTRDLVVAAPRAALASTVDAGRGTVAAAPLPEHAGVLQVYTM